MLVKMLPPDVSRIQTVVVTRPSVFQVHVLVQLALADLLAAATLMAATLLGRYDAERSVNFCPFGLPLALVRFLFDFESV